jgi:uncharacterized protein (TIRG00374 family)
MNTPSIPTRVFIPYLSDHAYAMAGVIRGMGIDAEVLPKSGDESMAIGLSLCRGRECLPCFLCVGDILLKCREPGFDFGNWAFIMPRGPGPCRFGQYNVLQKQILAEQGFPDVRIESPTSRDSYMLFGANPRTLRMRSSHAVMAVDLLAKLLHAHRPYEIEPSSADALYEACLERVVEGAEKGAGKHIEEALKWSAEQFSKLPVDRSDERPLVAVIGELYLMLNARSNSEIVRKVENAGGEVLHGTFMDYLHFVDWKRRKLDAEFRDWRDYIKGTLTDWYQQYWHGRMFRAIKPAYPHPPESATAKAMKDLRPYYDPMLGTEAVLTQSRALQQYEEGVAGFVNVLPFSCMPGTIAAAMAPVLRKDMDGVPWLDIAYDGQEDTNIHTRLEAFMHQVKQFDRRVVKVKENGHGPVGGDGASGNGRARGASRPTPEGGLSRRKLVRGSITFSILTAIGLIVLTAATGGFEALSQATLKPLILAAAVAVAMVEFGVASLRYHAFVRRVRPGTPFSLSLRGMFANRFAASVTPSQTGGGPALLYIFQRSGISVGEGLSILVVNFVLTMTAMLAASIWAILYLGSRLSLGSAESLLGYAVVAAAAMLALVVVALIRPDAIIRRLDALRARMRSGRRIDRLIRLLVDGLAKYRSTARLLIRRSPAALSQAAVLTVVLFAAKYFLAWLIVLGLGIEASVLTVFAVHALLHFIVYLAPSPGGSGVAEIGTGALMAIVLPAALLGPFTLLYRALLVYLPAVGGAAVLFSALRRQREAASRIAVRPIAAARPASRVSAAEALLEPAEV